MESEKPIESNVRFQSRSFVRFLIGLTVFLIFQMYILGPSTISTHVGFIISKFIDKNQSQEHQQQHNEQEQQQSFSFSPVSNIYINLSGQNIISGSHSTTHLNRPNENTTTAKNSINITNKFRNSSLINRNYNLNLVSDPLSDVNYETLLKADINNLIDLHNFEYIINQKSCQDTSLLSSSLSTYLPGTNVSSSELKVRTENHRTNSSSEQRINPRSIILLILVPSAPQNYIRRMIIRETWGSPANSSNDIRLIFLLAAVKENGLQESLENENRIYSDIVQGNFIDDYRNMTYKHVMAFKWFIYYCRNANYILKMDDDVFVNTPQLIDYLKNVADRNNLIFCLPKSGSPVARGNETKWAVSKKEYYADYYPTYCTGHSILYSSDVAFRLYLEAQKSPYFWIDDVHVTGTLAQQANITITPILEYELKADTMQNILAGKSDINDNPFIFIWPLITEHEIRKLWKLVENLILLP